MSSQCSIWSIFQLFFSMLSLIKNVLESGGDHRVEMSYGRTEEYPLADIEKKRQPVRKERLHLESRSKTVDKASVIFKCRPVIELLVVPVSRLITGQSGKPGREEHVPATVREERHEIAYLSGKLRFGNRNVLVGIVLLHIIRPEQPAGMVPVIPAQSQVHLKVTA